MKSFNTIKFLRSHGIDHTQDHHHCTDGSVNVHCPFCRGNRNYHLGMLVNAGHGHCWRCGKHSINEIIRALLNCSWSRAVEIREEYEATTAPSLKRRADSPPTTASSISLPYCSAPLKDNERALDYLNERDFDPYKLADDWGLVATCPLGDYGNRIIAPIYFKGQLVSYQGRDITDESDLRYRACEKKDEIIHHKNVLYGIDRVKGDSIVVVEGITDVWRLGPGAVATFGTSFKDAQVNLLRHFDNIFIWFDQQDHAQKKAKELAHRLAIVSEVELITHGKEGEDPADLSQEEADECMNQLIKERG